MVGAVFFIKQKRWRVSQELWEGRASSFKGGGVNLSKKGKTFD